MSFKKRIGYAATALLLTVGSINIIGYSQGNTTSAKTVAENAAWGDNVKLTFEGNNIIIESNGIPNHEYLDAYQQLNRNNSKSLNYVKESPTRLQIPLNPQLADQSTPANMGTIGIAISGAVFFNPYEADGRTFANEDNFTVDGIPFIDNCGGHPAPQGRSYHYHGIPYCITATVDKAGEHSRLIGYLLDGFPVYGPQDVNGAAPTDLDECSGHFGTTPEFPEGIYHYHTSTERPYSISCFKGEVDASLMQPGGPGGNMGGNPGGGNPGGTGRPPGGGGTGQPPRR